MCDLQSILHDTIKTIETAVRAGLNYVDTSPFYGEGKSEEVLGRIFDNDGLEGAR